MSAPRRTLATTAAAALALATAALALSPASVSATPPSATYTITVGSTGTYAYPTDTPAGAFLDKDGSFYFQQSASLYGATDPHYWDFYSGSTFDDATRNATISNYVNPANPQDANDNTVYRCEHSPTGTTATDAPTGSGYAMSDYCDLVGVWVDPDTGDWYGLVHNEFTPQPFGDGLHYDAIDDAVSHDQGRTWDIAGHAITSPYSTTRGDTTAFPNQTYSYGDGDQRLFVDPVSGYFYVYYGSRVVPKGGVGGSTDGLAHVARCPIAAKMTTGCWQKWYDGTWSQPGVGGRESNMVPVDSSNANGYTPVAQDYSPANTGTVDQQVAAGVLPSKSKLFIMNIAYDAYLGLYIGEPEVVSGTQPQLFYVTDDLSTQKWYLIGDSGSYTSGSWYRWFVDGVDRTGSTLIGKSFRSYCSIACHSSDGEYANITVASTSPAAPPVDTTKTYTIGTANGRVLAQISGSSATTSEATATGTSLEDWAFTGLGDGSYEITNAATGQALGVDAGTTAARAWGTKPTATAPAAGGPTVGQQWFVVPNKASAGTFRLVNRYSGLALGLSSESTRPAETTPVRTWTNTTGDSVGGTRTAAEQTLRFTVAGATGPGNLNGTHVLTASGKALDDPNHSLSAGTQLITWTPNGGSNQNWVFTQQSDGSYQIVNGQSNLCMDDYGGYTTAGTQVIQYTCTGNSNQHWTLTQASTGVYKVKNVHSGLLLTTASIADGALVTQQADTGSALQQWTVG